MTSFRAWNRDLTEHAKTLDDQIARLDKLSKIWKSTLQLPELSRTAPEILKRVQSLIDSIGRTQHAVESRRGKDLTLQGRVLEATARLQTASSALRTGASQRREKTFSFRDSPPIWNAEVRNWREERPAPSLSCRAGANVSTAYIKRRPAVFLLHAIIILLLFLVVHWLRRGVHKWTKEEPSLQRAAPVFDLPVSTAIMLSFLITATDLFAGSVFAPGDPWGSTPYPHRADSPPVN